jgi:hypothetical protein
MFLGLFSLVAKRDPIVAEFGGIQVSAIVMFVLAREGRLWTPILYLYYLVSLGILLYIFVLHAR